MNKEMFLEQVKYISNLKAILDEKLNYQTLCHAYNVDSDCIKDSSGEIFDQAYEFVDLMKREVSAKSS